MPMATEVGSVVTYIDGLLPKTEAIISLPSQNLWPLNLGGW